MNQDIIKIIVGYLSVEHRLVCREWSKLIPYNINKLEDIFSESSNTIFEEVKNYEILRKFVALLTRTNRLNLGKCCMDCTEFGEMHLCLAGSVVCYRCLYTHSCNSVCKYCNFNGICSHFKVCDECEVSMCDECYNFHDCDK